ncbi:hypothetical protein [Laceyella putida]|uniref:DUF2269 family protein n=1 Tax=Laceyella putida TaxID=110101 RepID=A0ABW2RKS0_9BACL
MAYRLNLRKKNLLVSIHVLSIVAWFGGAMCMFMLGLYMKNAKNGEQLYYILSDMHLIDATLIRYPALVVFISGVLLSVWTQWGLVKYYWIVIKLVLTTLIIIFGIMFLGDWLSFLLETAHHYGFTALQKHDFQTTSLSLILASAMNILAMTIMTCVTYFKPFGKIKKSAKST